MTSNLGADVLVCPLHGRYQKRVEKPAVSSTLHGRWQNRLVWPLSQRLEPHTHIHKAVYKWCSHQGEGGGVVRATRPIHTAIHEGEGGVVQATHTFIRQSTRVRSRRRSNPQGARNPQEWQSARGGAIHKRVQSAIHKEKGSCEVYIEPPIWG